MSSEVVARARSLVGVRFKPQGRGPATGLDCVGVVLHTFAIPSGPVCASYRLRGNHDEALRSALRHYFDDLAPDDCRSGDVLLLRVAPEQVHLAVNCGEVFVHADAGIGRVVETPGPPAWPVISVHRFRTPGEF